LHNTIDSCILQLVTSATCFGIAWPSSGLQIDTNLCKPDDGQARPKHVADVTICRIQLSIVLCKDGLIQSNLAKFLFLVINQLYAQNLVL